MKNTKNKTVKWYRQNGYKVRVLHYRNKELKKGKTSSYLADSQMGGFTVVELTTPNDKTYTGKAICSKEERFNRKLGVRIALGRAEKAMWEDEG